MHLFQFLQETNGTLYYILIYFEDYMGHGLKFVLKYIFVHKLNKFYQHEKSIMQKFTISQNRSYFANCSLKIMSNGSIYSIFS